MQYFWLLQSTWQFQMEDFQKEVLAYFIFEHQQLLPKVDEIRFIVKKSNVSIIGISESKLDLSILNN